ncbi:hypothetical protein BC567DRAFT_98288 [Phyllosticta citribraziliensis]
MTLSSHPSRISTRLDSTRLDSSPVFAQAPSPKPQAVRSFIPPLQLEPIPHALFSRLRAVVVPSSPARHCFCHYRARTVGSLGTSYAQTTGHICAIVPKSRARA